ncbi:MAG TPA: hypothetical protein VFE56_13205 [Candidatus Binataceae bacterium]|nr:hypothetical protein [Candidatus Binataceae bacterium]
MRRPAGIASGFIIMMRQSIMLTALAIALLVTGGDPPATAFAQGGSEASRVAGRVLAVPRIKAAPGFSARIVVPPGDLYDPLQMVPRGDQVWVNDDGGEAGKGGGRLVAVDRLGKVSVLAGPENMLPDVGMDEATENFGAFGGQIFLLTQPAAGEKGLWANHLIQHWNPENRRLELFCTLPPAGKVGNGKGAAGSALWFGPPQSPFGGRIFVVTTSNHMIYQAAKDGKCTPFADFGDLGLPLELTFTPDHQWMLVSVTPTTAAGAPDAAARRGMIMKVSAKGEIEPKPLVWGLGIAGGMAFAPRDFGRYGGQLFFTDLGEFQTPVPMTQALRADGTIVRFSHGGIPELVASGFVNPLHLRFIGNKLWVSDLNGDFLGGKRELPDGFIVEISASPKQ